MSNQTKAVVGIIAALPVELDAILSNLPSECITFEKADNRTYYRGQLTTTSGKELQVITTLLPSMGNLSSALATSDLIRL
ncbi:MAG: 5'-methylthioadenosine/S-adenosylhomocysteine nucleosidase [Desulfobulbaceae bacterium]|nr:5'-methylthioadenosine/S-adenosylhomocysteine nucleosidase [Desulfobulbaceae bacterium]